MNYPELEPLSADATKVDGGALARLNENAGSGRIRDFIEENSVKIPESGCWIWMKSLTARGGYGQVSYGSYGTEKAHRLSMVAFHGGIPADGLYVCHTCDTPSCVNPNHLFLGDGMDNHKDMVSKGRGNYARIAKQMRKLSDEAVRAIRASKGTQLQLAEKYGVSGGAIGQIRRNCQYKDVL